MKEGNSAIRSENMSKCYRIGLKEDLNDSFVKSAFGFMKSPLKNYRKYRSLYNFKDIDVNDSSNSVNGVIWALRDATLNVKKGEVLGIIGRNGAGKSTLLKIISRITNPTSGHAEIYGRISSLLEVGTGFHPDLTGRENVYLNATILGMTKKEVDRRFDEIVDFSGVEKFIDTPVKRYSSGMKVRLAFSVAAHLEPEIMIIDEVLAVGDTEFQKKCLNKMEDVGTQGRTVLFVSHNIPAVTRLCNRVIMMEEGRIVHDGLPHEVVGAYLSSGMNTTAMREWSQNDAPGGEVARLHAIRIINNDGKIAESVDIRESFSVEMEYEVLQSGYVLLPHFYFFTQEGVCAFGTLDVDPAWMDRPRPEGRYVSSVVIPGNFLSDGIIYINAALGTMYPFVVQFWEKSVVSFQAIDCSNGDSALGNYTGKMGGVVRPLLQWNTQFSRLGDQRKQILY